jgi:hypothetical protein
MSDRNGNILAISLRVTVMQDKTRQYQKILSVTYFIYRKVTLTTPSILGNW